MDLPADQSTRTSASRLQPPPTAPLRSPRRRRPSGEAPPLPHHLQTTGVGWLVASVVLVALSRWPSPAGCAGPPSRHGPGRPVVRWLAGSDAPWLVRAGGAGSTLVGVLNTLALGYSALLRCGASGT